MGPMAKNTRHRPWVRLVGHYQSTAAYCGVMLVLIVAVQMLGGSR